MKLEMGERLGVRKNKGNETENTEFTWSGRGQVGSGQAVFPAARTNCNEGGSVGMGPRETHELSPILCPSINM